jgi:hypothetical protein
MVSTDDTQIPVQTGATTTPVSTDFDLGLDTPATPEVADFSLETPISAETDTPASVSDDFSLDLGSDAFAPATPLAEETTLLPDTSEPTLDFSEQPIEQPSSEPVVPLSEPVVNEETSNDFSFDLGADAFAPATPLDEETTPLQEEPVKQPEPALDFSEPAGSEETSNDFSFDLGADAFAPATPLTEPTLNLSEPVAEIAEPSIEQPLEESTSGLFTPIEGTDTPSIPNSLENPESFAPISSPDTPPVDFSEVTSDETATPSSDYQPTPDAFSQTVEALNTAKAEGTTFMSSEDLPSSTPETSSPEEEKVLNLDQMVAKFNGEDIPADPIDDPFAPMKKALEDEERKELEEKGVDANGVPLVLSPEAEEKVPVATPDISAVDTDTTSAPAEIADPIASEEETIPEPQPEQQETPEVSSEPAGTLSLDDIIDTGTIAIPQESQPAVEVSTKMDLSGILEKLKKNPMILAGAGSIVILIFVLVTMFPSGSNNPAETTIPEITQPQIPDPDHNSAIETPNNS